MAHTTVQSRGVERIAAAFERARGARRAALMPYLMGGYPDAAAARLVARALVEAGADVIELGVPFSDPLADGPAIHAAATQALAAGATFEGVLEIAAEVGAELPVVLMVYANMVVRRDPGELARMLATSQVAGVIVPDLPPEEAVELRAALGERGIAFVPLVAPTSAPARRRKIAGLAQGFLYVVSDTRTTGERDELPAGLREQVAAAKADSRVPVAVGFGISTPAHAAEVGGFADGVIVASRLIREIGEAADGPAAATAVREWVEAARAALAGA